METLEIFKEELRYNSIQNISKRNTSRDLKIVAEGDSWFDYPLVMDVIDHLRKSYCIYKESEAGDTLENMVYGNDYTIIRRKHNAKNMGPIDLQETLFSIKRYKPRFVLFSAGGNDIVGQEMGFYINHKRIDPKLKGTDLIRKKVFTEMLNNVMLPTIEYFCQMVWATNKNLEVDILMDGYDYAKPNGKSYFGLAGPWILPNFGKKAITTRTEQKAIIKYLVDGYNGILKKLERKYSKFHHVDLRGMFPKSDQWHNEIHIKGREYAKVARVYHKKIVSILGYDPTK